MRTIFRFIKWWGKYPGAKLKKAVEKTAFFMINVF